jgi:hypothetical protein
MGLEALTWGGVALDPDAKVVSTFPNKYLVDTLGTLAATAIALLASSKSRRLYKLNETCHSVLLYLTHQEHIL